MSPSFSEKSWQMFCSSESSSCRLSSLRLTSMERKWSSSLSASFSRKATVRSLESSPSSCWSRLSLM